MVAAVAAGFGMLFLLIIFFLVVSFMLRYAMRMERHKIPKTSRGKSLTGGAVAFYGGQEVQSAQALFSSLSATNIVSGASDVHLDAHGRSGVYHNRAFESVSSMPSSPDIGGGSGVNLYENAYKPIEIKSQSNA